MWVEQLVDPVDLICGAIKSLTLSCFLVWKIDDGFQFLLGVQMADNKATGLAVNEVSNISRWYDNRSIFITGATGFMGKVSFIFYNPYEIFK